MRSENVVVVDKSIIAIIGDTNFKVVKSDLKMVILESAKYNNVLKLKRVKTKDGVKGAADKIYIGKKVELENVSNIHFSKTGRSTKIQKKVSKLPSQTGSTRDTCAKSDLGGNPS